MRQNVHSAIHGDAHPPQIRRVGKHQLRMSGQTGPSLGAEMAWPWSLSEGLARQLTAITCLTNRLRLKRSGGTYGLLHCPTRHGDVVFQVISSFVAQSLDLSVGHDVQGLGILYAILLLQ
jgi:hypothetical protein